MPLDKKLGGTDDFPDGDEIGLLRQIEEGGPEAGGRVVFVLHGDVRELEARRSDGRRNAQVERQIDERRQVDVDVAGFE